MKVYTGLGLSPIANKDSYCHPHLASPLKGEEQAIVGSLTLFLQRRTSPEGEGTISLPLWKGLREDKKSPNCFEDSTLKREL